MTTTMKPIPGFEGYYAGNDGHIYSYWRSGPKSRIDCDSEPRKKAPQRSTGHRYLTLSLRSTDGRSRSRPIHTLVALAFHGERPTGTECSHINGNAHDNRPDNLVWETRQQNHRRKIEHGTSRRGQRHPLAKLTQEQAATIKTMALSGIYTQSEIARIFKTHQPIVSRISRGQSYNP